MEEQQTTARSLAGCGWPLKGCAVITVMVILGLVGLLVYVLMLPGMRELRECQANMMEIGDALGRYYDVNGEYPPDLDTLAKEYLKNRSVLRCPLSGQNKPGSSYTYNRPGPRSTGDFAVLVCDCHKMRRDTPIRKLVLLKNGRVKVESLSLREFERKSRRTK